LRPFTASEKWRIEQTSLSESNTRLFSLGTRILAKHRSFSNI
jgi:hypothetical protein